EHGAAGVRRGRAGGVRPSSGSPLAGGCTASRTRQRSIGVGMDDGRDGTRGERIRAMRQLQSVYDAPVLPVSASTGEGMEDLWKLIASLSKPRPRRTN